MTTRHTPGSWEFSRDGQDCIIGKDGIGIALLAAETSETDWTAGIVMHGEESTANGRLLAAAPDLLTACKAMLGINSPPAGDPGHIDFGTVANMARAAVAKATGAL